MVPPTGGGRPRKRCAEDYTRPARSAEARLTPGLGQEWHRVSLEQRVVTEGRSAWKADRVPHEDAGTGLKGYQLVRSGTLCTPKRSSTNMNYNPVEKTGAWAHTTASDNHHSMLIWGEISIRSRILYRSEVSPDRPLNRRKGKKKNKCSLYSGDTGQHSKQWKWPPSKRPEGHQGPPDVTPLEVTPSQHSVMAWSALHLQPNHRETPDKHKMTKVPFRWWAAGVLFKKKKKIQCHTRQRMAL